MKTIFIDEFSREVFEQTYQYNEETIDETHRRIAKELASVENDPQYWEELFIDVLSEFKFVPGGRIISNMGTGLKGTTSINCFVDGFTGTDQDSMEGILDALRRQALILKSEGGYGFCADVMRPRGGFIEGIGNSTPGAVKMLDMWDTQSAVITEGSGKKNNRKDSKKKIRKGAQMVTMSVWHPDILEFITAKQTPGRLTKFNMSVLITDDFMDAVKNHKSWNLEFPDFDHVQESLYSFSEVDSDSDYTSIKALYKDKWDGNLKNWKKHNLPTKIYKTFEDATELWNIILKSTYNRNEPGVLFVDTINKFNNLWYKEYISATNPCGEQILPVGGVCLLGSLNLTQFVKNNDWDYEKLEKVIPLAVRMMDNVNDITYVPLPSQKQNLQDKRRIGLGILGYGSALMMMRVPYGSKKALELTENLMKFIANTAYRSSMLLSDEKGPFPLFDTEKYLQSKFIEILDPKLVELIRKFGIRNSHLLSIQPTGNTSVFANNVSGGLEPVFLPEYIRTSIQPYPATGMEIPININWEKREFECKEYHKKEKRNEKDWNWVKEGDENMLSCKWDGEVWKMDKNRGLLKETVVKDYAVRYLEDMNLWEPKAEWVSTIDSLKIDEHINTMAVIAKYIDSAMSKTINIPNDYSYDDFKKVYEKLYDTGVVKGGTTYRAGTMATVLKSTIDDTIDPITGRNGKIVKTAAPVRPKEVDCDIHHITAIGKQWVVLVGMLHNEPYEAFAFRKDQIQLSPRFEKGKLIKIKRGHYNLEIPDVITLENITSLFAKDEHEALTRLVSTALRHGIDPLFIFEQLDKSEGTIQSFSKALGRTLKRYINRPPTDTKCPSCGDPKGLAYTESCVKCKTCSWSEC